MLDQTIRDLQNKFKIKDLGELKFFLGIEFARYEKGIVMNQRKYALEFISESGLSGAKPVGTPLELNQKMTSVDYDTWLQSDNAATDEKLKDPSIYQRLMGRLLYLTMTRPGLEFAVQFFSQYMHCPKTSHLEVSLRVGACVDPRRSVIGYLVKLGGALISWKSKKQETVSRSSVEAEFRSMASCTAEITWLVGLFKELGICVDLRVQLMCDSKAAIQIASN
ncbi:PREDICTED: uncharacterized protein LOC109233564 [Nicotiana attenuata]|uniref:uncharacterized protein LOC109233564 n=1 Tax=Nicotiana attenuata TaxID=49451 RepID=UPI000904EA82|nr:PREDICTED: uncharacterized protein LOC109233564 [Nicotiana attenuata]